MSDVRFHAMGFDVPAEHAGARAADLREWLRASGWSVLRPGLVDWILANPNRPGTPAADAGGPRYGEATDVGAPVAITVQEGWRGYGFKPDELIAQCPDCGCPTGLIEVLEHWGSSRRAPVLECGDCGFHGPATEFDLLQGFGFCYLAVTMEPSPTGAEKALFRDLREQFGGQWGWTYSHL